MRIGSLFSGIGGLELGLERAGLGSVVWQVERSAFCRHILARHWPDVERFDDVRTVGSATLVPVDLLCGGFPCQDVSAAGAGAGLAGARSGLWYEMRRIIGELAPRWVVIENVASGARRWLPDVRRDLWALGYAALPIRVRASDVGARHLRARIFVVAADLAGDGGGAWRQLAWQERAGFPGAEGAAADPDNNDLRLQQGRRERAHRRGAAQSRIADAAAHVADAHRARLAEWSRERGDALGELAPAERDAEPWEGAGVSEPALVRNLHGVSGRLDRAAGRVRRARVSSLGNSVVPACAEVVGRLIASAAVEA